MSVGVPNKEPPTKNGENIWSPFTEPDMDGRPTYNRVLPGCPRASFKTLQSVPVPCGLQQDTCHKIIKRIAHNLKTNRVALWVFPSKRRELREVDSENQKHGNGPP